MRGPWSRPRRSCGGDVCSMARPTTRVAADAPVPFYGAVARAASMAGVGREMLTSLVVTKKTASDAIVVMVFGVSARGGSTR